jgi:hypothetical protein
MLVRGNRRFYESVDLGFQPLYVMEKLGGVKRSSLFSKAKGVFAREEMVL